MAAVMQNGQALQYATDTLRGNAAVVRAAASQIGKALHHGSAATKVDRDIVLAAVSQDGRVLQHADASLKAHPEIVHDAVAQAPKASRHAARGLRDFAALARALKDGHRARRPHACGGASGRHPALSRCNLLAALDSGGIKHHNFMRTMGAFD